MSTKFVQMRPSTLNSAIGTSDTQMILNGFVDLAGTPVVMTDFGTTGYGTIDPNTDSEEAISFSAITNTTGQATITMIRGLRGKAPYGIGGVAKAHLANAKFVISNNPDLLDKFIIKDTDATVTAQITLPAPGGANIAARLVEVTTAQTAAQAYADVGDAALQSQISNKVSKTGNETIAGIKTFSTAPIVPNAVGAFEPLTKGQFDAATQAAASDASSTVKGATKLSVDPVSPTNPIAVGVNDPALNAQATTAIFGKVRLSGAPDVVLGAFTVTLASPAVFTLTAHGLVLDDTITLATTGALYTGLAVATTYYIIAAGLTANNFQVSLTKGGTAVNTSGSQSGVHTLTRTSAVIGSSTKVTTFNSSGTFTKDSRTKVAFIETWGGGGGGGPGSIAGFAGGGGGGGGGGVILQASQIGTTETITIGAGGAGGVFGVGNGAQGGTTSFGTKVTSGGGGGTGGGAGGSGTIAGGGGGGITSGTGGGGGTASGLSGSAGGTSNTVPGGSTSYAGGGGGGGGTSNNGSSGGNSFSGGGGGGGGNNGQVGGNSFYGGGGGASGGIGSNAGGTSVMAGAGGISSTGSNPGSVGGFPGGGGGGGGSTSGGNGGNGGAGFVRVTEYF